MWNFLESCWLHEKRYFQQSASTYVNMVIAWLKIKGDEPISFVTHLKHQIQAFILEFLIWEVLVDIRILGQLQVYTLPWVIPTTERGLHTSGHSLQGTTQPPLTNSTIAEETNSSFCEADWWLKQKMGAGKARKRGCNAQIVQSAWQTHRPPSFSTKFWNALSASLGQ